MKTLLAAAIIFISLSPVTQASQSLKIDYASQRMSAFIVDEGIKVVRYGRLPVGSICELTGSAYKGEIDTPDYKKVSVSLPLVIEGVTMRGTSYCVGTIPHDVAQAGWYGSASFNMEGIDGSELVGQWEMITWSTGS